MTLLGQCLVCWACWTNHDIAVYLVFTPILVVSSRILVVSSKWLIRTLDQLRTFAAQQWSQQLSVQYQATLSRKLHISYQVINTPPDDALELQLFELQQKILCQAHSLAKNLEISSLAGHHAAKEGVMSKEALARFKSADVRLLALQWRKAALAEMARAVELDDDQAVQPAGIMKRAL